MTKFNTHHNKTHKQATLKALSGAVVLALAMTAYHANANPAANNTSSANARPANNASSNTNAATTATTSTKPANDYDTIGDLEIYKSPTGDTAVLLMLDTSGSMGVLSKQVDSVMNDYNVRCFDSERRLIKTEDQNYSITDKQGNNVEKVTYTYQYCEQGGKKYYDRMSRLKQALIGILADGQALPEDYKLGIGTFPSVVASKAGVISVPAKPLTFEHRKRLIEFVKTLKPEGSTPLAFAYAEAGAYMMGTGSEIWIGYSSTKPPPIIYVPVGQAVVQRGSIVMPTYCDEVTDNRDPNIKNLYVLQCKNYEELGYPSSKMDIVSTIMNLFPKDKYVYWLRDSSGNEREMSVRWNGRLGKYTFHGSQNYHQVGSTIYILRKESPRVDTKKRLVAAESSGFRHSHRDTKKPDMQSYQSPIHDGSSCDGYGIFFMTDGYPNYSKDNQIKPMMEKSLGYSTFNKSNDLPTNATASGVSSGWQWIGPYAKVLNDAKSNPKKRSIKTSTLGFGKSFTQFVDKATGKVDSCNTITNQDAKNLCKLGQELGGGGFIATNESDIVRQSIVDFAASLNTKISTLPAGTISVPSDPLSANHVQPYAYLPMIQPEVSKNFTTWQGNLKKYHTLTGTLYGQDKKRLYIKSSAPTDENVEFPSKINPEARDIWQVGSESDNSKVDVGGSRSQLTAPTATNKNARTIYVEDKGNLVKIGVVNGALTGAENLSADYSAVDVAYVLNLLGFAVPTEEKAYTGDRTAQFATLKSELGKATVTGVKALGGVVHSVPVLAAYSGEYDNKTGNISSDEAKRDDRLLYGSMDGVLHMVEAKTGQESFGFIPRAVFADKEQRHALLPSSTHIKVGMPKFGIDAPWAVRAEYDVTDDKMKANKMFAYGGMRMGGVGLYGLDITQPSAPKLAFAINNDTTGFGRLGQTWAKPLVATIKTGPNLTDRKKVLFVGGGYDMCYENPLFKLNDPTNANPECQNLSETKGNAVYMLDADNGELLQTWTSQGASTDAKYMKHSIVSEIVPADRNSNGFVDHLYFADLGGQVFRIDLKEGVGAKEQEMTRNVVRVFDANAGITTANHIPYRFYEKPAVSIHVMGSSRVAMIAISSGDRSSPTHKRRDLADANRIYGIVDRDVTTSRVYTGNNLVSQNIKTSDLQYYKTIDVIKALDAQRLQYVNDLISGTKKGWYYDMTRFETDENVKNLKAIGSSVTIGNIYYTSIYNPEYRYTKVGSCESEVLGGTERQMFCMPWGICVNRTNGRLISESPNGTLGFSKGGPGIQELVIGTLTPDENTSTNFRGFIGPSSIQERTVASSSGSGTSTGNNAAMAHAENFPRHTKDGGNKQQAEAVVSEDFVFQMKRWYDLQNAEMKN